MLQFNMARLYRLLKDFHTLTDTRIVLFDSNFVELLSYPEERFHFCTAVRATEEGERRCRKCDQDGCKRCASTGELEIYRCHAGLTEVVVPVLDKTGTFAYIMFGQVLNDSTADATKKQILQRLSPQWFSGTPELVEQIPVKSVAEINATATILRALTVYALSNHWLIPGKADFIRQMDQYIVDHMDQPINVEDICEQFHMGRTRLYDAANEYLGCGLAEYIRQKRIEHARTLLIETDLQIADIAYATGFSDYNHFSRVFKQIVGTTARSYRKKAEEAPTK